MKQAALRWSLPVLLALASGCESARLEKSDASPGFALPLPAREFNADDESVLAAAAAQPSSTLETGERELFDGRTLGGWQVIPFAGAGDVRARTGLIALGRGEPFTGIRFTNASPVMNYEVSLDAMRVSGNDFFCGLTFPVGERHCSLIVGGWGGSLVGLSSLDGADASENETTQYITFQSGRWYRIRVRVTTHRIEAWIEQKKIVDVVTTGRMVSTRFGEIEQSKPLGVTSWSTAAALRAIRIREVAGPVAKD